MQDTVVLPLDPDEIVTPEETPEQDAEPTPTVEPTPEPEEEEGPRFEMRSRSKEWSNLHLDPGGLRIPSNGMPIPLLYQYDYNKTVCIWEGDSKSVATSGCGAASASMVIAYVHKNYDQTPYTLFYRAADNGWYRGDGLDYDAIRSLLSSNGVDSRLMGVSSDGIISALRENRPIIIKMGPGTFTDDGHYIVLRGLDEDGKVLVNDPNSSSRSQRSYSAQQIARECKSQHMIVVYTRPDDMPVQVEEPTPEQTSEPAPEMMEEIQESTSVAETAEAEPVREEDIPAEVPASEDGVFEGAYLGAVNYKSVNLREAPVDGLIVTSVKEGTVLRVVGEVMAEGRVWCAVEYRGSTLYIRGDMLNTEGVTGTPEEFAEAETAAPEITAAPETAVEPVQAEAEPEAEAESMQAAAVEPEPEALPVTEDGVFKDAYLAAVNYKSVNLREAPVDGLIVTSVKEGTVLKVIGEEQAEGRVWCAVEYQGSALYIRGDFLSADSVEMTMEEYEAQAAAVAVPEPEVVPESEPEVIAEPVPEVPASEDGVFDGAYLAAVNYKRVNLRDLPSADNTRSAVIISVPEGTVLCVVGEEADEDGRVWCAVLYQKQKLYIRGDMLTPLN